MATINLSNIANARLCASHAQNLALRYSARFAQLKGGSCLENLPGLSNIKGLSKRGLSNSPPFNFFKRGYLIEGLPTRFYGIVSRVVVSQNIVHNIL